MDEPASEVPQDEQEGDNFSNFTGGNRIWVTF
jgi:hypothetical protein